MLGLFVRVEFGQPILISRPGPDGTVAELVRIGAKPEYIRSVVEQHPEWVAQQAQTYLASPLHIAVEHERADWIPLLIELGYDPWAEAPRLVTFGSDDSSPFESTPGFSAIRYAIISNRVSCVDAFLTAVDLTPAQLEELRDLASENTDPEIHRLLDEYQP